MRLFPRQWHRKVYDEDDTLIGDYNAALFVDGRLIIELKAARALAVHRPRTSRA